MERKRRGMACCSSYSPPWHSESSVFLEFWLLVRGLWGDGPEKSCFWIAGEDLAEHPGIRGRSDGWWSHLLVGGGMSRESWEGRPNSLRRWEYIRFSRSSGTSLVALLWSWTFSTCFWSPLDGGPQTQLPYSKCGRIGVLSNNGRVVLLSLANDLPTMPRRLLALATAAAVYEWKLRVPSTMIPRPFSFSVAVRVWPNRV